MRPLDRLPSIKLKLGIVILAAVAVSATMSQVGFRLGWPVWLRPIVAACVSLLMVQFLARGMTSPLREMAAAANAMARGDYDRRVAATSQDEVGDLARAFNSMARDLAELDAERRALVGNAAHELRTPITGLQATFENLADGIVEPTPIVLDRVRVQVDRLAQLVAQLLDLSRLESPGTVHRIERVAVGAVATDVADRIGAIHPAAELAVDVDPDSTMIGDPDLIDRLIDNLVRNAIIHGEGKEVRVRVETSDGRTTLEVSDRGPGLAVAESEHIFDRFFRGENSRGEGRPGSGLGLAICRAIVDQHDGTIAARPQRPNGCVVTVTFPAQPPDRTSRPLVRAT